MQLPDENIEYSYQRLLSPGGGVDAPRRIQRQHFLDPNPSTS